MTHLMETQCRCGVKVMYDSTSTESPLCIECRRSDCGIDWAWFAPIGEWHPTVGYASPGLNDYVRPLIEEEPYPAPVVTSRQESAFLAPAPVLKLAEFAREAGWDVRTQYAQGYPPHGSTGRPGALKDSIAVIFGNHPLTDRQAYACYEKTASGSAWSWSGIMIRGSDVTPYAGCGIEHLKVFLSVPNMSARELAEWVAGIKAKRAAQAAAVKARPKAAPKGKEGMQ